MASQEEKGSAAPLSTRVEDRVAGPCRLLMLPVGAPSVVSWTGSFRANPDVAGGDKLVQALTTQLLDKGTQRRDRFALADALENRGSLLSITSKGLRVYFQGRAMREDAPFVLRLMAEMLRYPLFDDVEFEKARARAEAALQQERESTASQSLGALTRRLYSPAHPQYALSTEETLARLHALAPHAPQAYHARHFGATDMVFAFAGDLDMEAMAEAVLEAFSDWPVHAAPSRHESSARPMAPGRAHVEIPEKPNMDVRLGHALHLRRTDKDYMPLFVATFILGGNFSSRLMTKVRQEMGLTYGIHARLAGVTADADGSWIVGLTLNRKSLEKGLEATLAEINRFVEGGPTPGELRDKKTTICGAYKVGLGTTVALAATLHRYAIQGFDVSYLDRYPEDVEAVTLEDIRGALDRHLLPGDLHTATAGERGGSPATLSASR